ncbi:hypothetical protein SCHIN_v1c02420 [Spiroplasma chinense]|uniref:Uncharacterized protein n=1 Tax=Spiroplasma chinense TaxID=216932 RepID=A0A5B9Y439_9MOLU|nr:hypothetical protein [Spiroplasma chinense]QEH61439.1 hypothetical protein SCHIN_v1c02420 [Spiroplasma chinense]
MNDKRKFNFTYVIITYILMFLFLLVYIFLMSKNSNMRPYLVWIFVGLYITSTMVVIPIRTIFDIKKKLYLNNSDLIIKKMWKTCFLGPFVFFYWNHLIKNRDNEEETDKEAVEISANKQENE